MRSVTHANYGIVYEKLIPDAPKTEAMTGYFLWAGTAGNHSLF